MPLVELRAETERFIQSPAPEYLTRHVNQFDKEELKALVVGMHFVMRNDILSLSECPHRAVAASVFGEIPEDFSLCQVKNELARSETRGAVVKTGGNVYMYVVDVNRWTDRVEPRLNCKGVGIPWEMGLTSLVTGDVITEREQVDECCPKRKQDRVCNIEHAEPLALEGFVNLADRLKIERLDNCFIVCNWVSCPNCLDILIDNADLFNNSRVVNLFTAIGDNVDDQGIDVVCSLFEDEKLEHFHGPYFLVKKTNGYGWMPAFTEAIEQYFINLARPIFRVPQDDSELIKLSRKAYELALDRKIEFPIRFNLYE